MVAACGGTHGYCRSHRTHVAPADHGIASHGMSFHPNDIARRGRNAGIIVSGVIVVLLGSFFKTQVLNHSQWVMQSEDKRLRQIPIPAPRGVIFDRKGEVIAENSVSYNVSMLVKSRGELIEILDRLS